MKRHFVAVVLALLVVVGVSLYRLADSVRRPAQSSTQPDPLMQGSPQAPTAPTSPSERPLPGGPYVSSDPRWAIVREKDKLDRNWEWRMPINFYGRVVDENEQPISAVKVRAEWSDLSVNGASNKEMLSDAQGNFSITNVTGRGITIRVAKEGYYTSVRQHTSFDYAGFWEANYHEPDRAQPVTFHLRKKGVSAPLIAGEVQLPISADGTSVRLDLINDGRISPTGQFEIAALTNTDKYPPRRFDWRASITVHNGGLIEHNVEFPFEAPADGYQRTVEFVMLAESPDWKRAVEKAYFIRFGSPPRHGRIQIRFNGASQKAYLRYTVNPTGSRNLETATDDQFASP